MLLTLLAFGCTPETDGPDVTTDDTSTTDSVALATCEGPVGLNPGDCPPDMSTVLLSDGSQIDLNDFQGQRVVVLGTATW
jgi:hypothetical protein